MSIHSGRNRSNYGYSREGNSSAEAGDTQTPQTHGGPDTTEEASISNIFVSHRGADATQAARLAQELRAAGHHVWLDKWEINIGDSIIERINEGLEGAAYVVVCSIPLQR